MNLILASICTSIPLALTAQDATLARPLPLLLALEVSAILREVGLVVLECHRARSLLLELGVVYVGILLDVPDRPWILEVLNRIHRCAVRFP